MTGKEIVDIAEKYIDEHGLKFCKAYGFSYIVPWCVIYVWYVFKDGKASKLFFNGDKVCNVGIAENWLQRNTKRIKKIKDVLPGDIVTFTWKGAISEHMGIVRGYDGKDLLTIEGNTGTGDIKTSKVMKRRRAKKYIRGIYRPNYKEPVKPEIDYTDKIKKMLAGKYKDPVKALGTDYKIVEKECKRISDLTEKVLDGKLGNGDQRKKLLGSDYKLVQWNVNRLTKKVKK